MTMFDTEYYVYSQNRIMYHIILITGFVVAVKVIPWLVIKAQEFTSNTMIQQAATWLVAYIIAKHSPKLGFLLYKTLTNK